MSLIVIEVLNTVGNRIGIFGFYSVPCAGEEVALPGAAQRYTVQKVVHFGDLLGDGKMPPLIQLVVS